MVGRGTYAFRREALVGGRVSHRASAGGFTLIEVLFTVALIALVTGASVAGLRSMAKSDLRASATKMAGAIRYLFDRASTTGKVHRLVLDLDSGKYWAEVSEDRFLMPKERETNETRRKEAEAKAKEAEEERKRAEQREKEGQGAGAIPSRYKPEEFRPKRAEFNAFNESAMKASQVKNALIAGLYTPRLAEPLTIGRGYIYFFPLGMTEAAVVHLSDSKRESFYSLVVHPLTGRVQIKNKQVAPVLDKQYDDMGQEIVQ